MMIPAARFGSSVSFKRHGVHALLPVYGTFAGVGCMVSVLARWNAASQHGHPNHQFRAVPENSTPRRINAGMDADGDPLTIHMIGLGFISRHAAVDR
jgi:hypothetical protein